MDHAHNLMEIINRAQRENRLKALRKSKSGTHLTYVDENGKTIDQDGQLDHAIAAGWIEERDSGLFAVSDYGEQELQRYRSEIALNIATQLLEAGAAYGSVPEGSLLTGLEPQERISLLTGLALSLNSGTDKPAVKEQRYQMICRERELWASTHTEAAVDTAKERQRLLKQADNA